MGESPGTKEYKLTSPVRPSDVFEIQRFTYQESKWCRQNMLKRLMEEEQEKDRDSPLRGLLKPATTIVGKDDSLKDDDGLNFLTSQNIPIASVTKRRGPGRPPKINRDKFREQA